MCLFDEPDFHIQLLDPVDMILLESEFSLNDVDTLNFYDPQLFEAALEVATQELDLGKDWALQLEYYFTLA